VPAAIEFQKKYNWDKVREQCHELLKCGLEHLQTLTGLEPAYANDTLYHQLAISPLPKIADLAAFKNKLYDDYLVEIPLTEYKDQQFARISVQGYNTEEDVNKFVTALKKMLDS
jgi:isopenicillin-N epimerase